MLTKWRHFIQKHEDKKWYKHFDLPCSLASPSINAYVCNPKFVAQHAYYPFIHKTLVQRKAKKGVRGKIVLVEKLREIFFLFPQRSVHLPKILILIVAKIREVSKEALVSACCHSLSFHW